MAFDVGDIVRKIGGTQKLEVVEVVGAKYKTKYYPRPPYSETTVLTYKEAEIELVP